MIQARGPPSGGVGATEWESERLIIEISITTALVSSNSHVDCRHFLPFMEVACPAPSWVINLVSGPCRKRFPPLLLHPTLSSSSPSSKYPQ